MRRSAHVFVVVGAAALVAALPAAAKEDVQATLASAVALDAPSGTELTVAWSLFSVDETGQRQPFGANGVFVRLLSASGAASQVGVSPVGAYDTGEYEASVVVPEGGIRDIEIGLTGWVSDANGTRRSDVIFPITNDPIPSPPPIPASSSDKPAPGGSDASSSWGLILAASLLSVLALVVGGFLIRRRRGPGMTGPAGRELRVRPR